MSKANKRIIFKWDKLVSSLPTEYLDMTGILWNDYGDAIKRGHYSQTYIGDKKEIAKGWHRESLYTIARKANKQDLSGKPKRFRRYINLTLAQIIWQANNDADFMPHLIQQGKDKESHVQL